MDDVFRVGGGSLENLRLKPQETRLNPPGISVLKGGSPREAAERMKAAYPNAAALHESAKVVGSTNEEAIRDAGFQLMPDPSRRFPNHHRVIHPSGVAGFVDPNLKQLSQAFTDHPLDD